MFKFFTGIYINKISSFTHHDSGNSNAMNGTHAINYFYAFAEGYYKAGNAKKKQRCNIKPVPAKTVEYAAYNKLANSVADKKNRDCKLNRSRTYTEVACHLRK